jgi:hypothetical protein
VLTPMTQIPFNANLLIPFMLIQLCGTAPSFTGASTQGEILR